MHRILELILLKEVCAVIYNEEIIHLEKKEQDLQVSVQILESKKSRVEQLLELNECMHACSFKGF